MRTFSAAFTLFTTSLVLGACTDAPTDPSRLLVSGGAPAASQGPAPFRGTHSGSALLLPDADCPSGVRASAAAGGGTATHLGRYTIVSQSACFDGSNGTFTWRAANGDLLHGQFTFGAADPVDGIATVTSVDMTITGGTGRFAAASGSLSLDPRSAGVIILTPDFSGFDFDVGLVGALGYAASGRAE